MAGENPKKDYTSRQKRAFCVSCLGEGKWTLAQIRAAWAEAGYEGTISAATYERAAKELRASLSEAGAAPSGPVAKADDAPSGPAAKADAPRKPRAAPAVRRRGNSLLGTFAALEVQLDDLGHALHTHQGVVQEMTGQGSRTCQAQMAVARERLMEVRRALVLARAAAEA